MNTIIEYFNLFDKIPLRFDELMFKYDFVKKATLFFFKYEYKLLQKQCQSKYWF